MNQEEGEAVLPWGGCCSSLKTVVLGQLNSRKFLFPSSHTGELTLDLIATLNEGFRYKYGMIYLLSRSELPS